MDPAETYNPIEEAGAAFEFAAVRTPEEAVEFVSRHGLLHAGPVATQHRERWTKIDEEAYGLRLVMRFYEIVQRCALGDADAMAELRSLGPNLAKMFEAEATNDEELLLQATKFVAWSLSDGTSEVTMSVEMAAEWGGRPGELVLSHRFPDLLSSLYVEFSMFATQREVAGRCPECMRIFPVDDPRQQYCSKRCAQRARHRRWATKKKGAK